jgi:glucan biosynthesis protein C
MRAILILFIVITHIFQSFNPNASWLIYNRNDITISPFVIDFLMLFTLQSFFIMSGYLAAMSIKKVGVQHFFDSRIKRVVIPILFTALTFNSVQAYLLSQSKLIEITLYSYVIKGQWISHLWFLIDLAIFFLFSYFAVIFTSSIIKKANDLFNIIFEKFGLYTLLSLLAFVILILTIIFSILSPYIYNQIIDIKSIFFYFPFFIFGTLLFNNQNIFKSFIDMPIIKTLFLTMFSISFSLYFKDATNDIEKIAYYFFDAISNIFSSALCFTFFNKFFNKKSKLFLFLADASFSIYLFHHLFVIAIGLLLINLNIGGYLGFFILFGIIMLITLSIHHFLISKITLLAFLYNGKELKKEK